MPLILIFICLLKILDRVLSSFGLQGWFRHAYFDCHAHVRLRFKPASGLGEPWTRDGRMPFENDVYSSPLFALVPIFVCSGGGSASVIC